MLADLLLMLALATTPAPAGAKPSTNSASPDQNSIEDYCKTRACRHDVDITLRDRSGKPMHMQRKLMPPAVEPDMVSVLPGETVEAVAEFKDGKFSRWRVPSPKDGADSFRISIELKQNAGDAGMAATIRNSGPKGLKLGMGVIRAEPNSRPEATSSCPLVAKGSGHEMWPFPVGYLLVRDARILAPTDKVACE